MASVSSLLKTLRLMYSFYRRFCLVTLGLTACCIAIGWDQGISTFAPLFWFKIISLLLVWYLVQTFQSNVFYYYWNLGVSKSRLWVFSLGFDFLLFLLGLVLTYQFR